ncbi:DUF5691 domain-containing protein [Methylobacterium sp. NEAU 140]|uniref:DUF5691 domain-containing protein n=1 Tax=Methylobacterium sp. NEAU 140 TaxID=3064945 RepID=UPI0027351E93|nr:DUF5691 domain-containing protein [Methylobacterium sp. NEAU 140]MDP4022873.1 DUF5691 domain-containing protein [Methylobacterium sp. NEAU 140]
MAAAPAPAADWDATLAAALLGADRAPRAGPPLPGVAPVEGPGGALLARVAAQGLLHLAGAGLAPEAMIPAPERPPAGPECPPAAARRLHALIGAGAPAEGRRREWFALAAAAGLRAPSWLLAELAALRGADAAPVRAVAGPELDWLARACGDTSAGEDAGEAPEAEDGAAARLAALVALRARDPDGAREALAAGFRGEKAKLRAALLPVLEAGLGPADEPFLEACLDDRAGDVRACAQRLLTRLPGSRLADRMAARARAALAIESRRHLLVRTKHALVVTLPEESPELARDGVAPRPYERDATGRRAAMLRDILEAAPLRAFADHPPRLWIELALCSAWPIPLFEGFYRCVRGEADPEWIRALVAVLGEACDGRLAGASRLDALPEMRARCLALLPAADWEAAVTELFGRRLDALIPILARPPPQLSETFTDALLRWLALVTRGSEELRGRLGREWCVERLGEAAAPTGRAAAAAAAIRGALPEGGEPLRGQIARMAETLELRAAMRREFGDPNGNGSTPGT